MKMNLLYKKKFKPGLSEINKKQELINITVWEEVEASWEEEGAEACLNNNSKRIKTGLLLGSKKNNCSSSRIQFLMLKSSRRRIWKTVRRC